MNIGNTFLVIKDNLWYRYYCINLRNCVPDWIEKCSPPRSFCNVKYVNLNIISKIKRYKLYAFIYFYLYLSDVITPRNCYLSDTCTWVVHMFTVQNDTISNIQFLFNIATASKIHDFQLLRCLFEKVFGIYFRNSLFANKFFGCFHSGRTWHLLQNINKHTLNLIIKYFNWYILKYVNLKWQIIPFNYQIESA